MSTVTTQPTQDKLPTIAPSRLPYHPGFEQRFGVDPLSWKALVEAIFPNATSVESVMLALSYCHARKLDIFKRCVHIVPIWSKEKECMVDTIWPGIGELRTTAFRTGEYVGRDETTFGSDITQCFKYGDGDSIVTYPEWAQVTVHRLVKGVSAAFVGPKVYWIETYATASRKTDAPNDMWRDRPRGQLCKCAEAAALRAAFPEEVGGSYIPDEVQHRGATVDAKPVDDKKIASLERLTEQLESEAPKEQAKPDVPATTSQEPPSDGQDGDPWDRFSGAVKAADKIRDVDQVASYWISRVPPTRSTEAIQLVEARKKELRESRKSQGGQPQLMDTAPTADDPVPDLPRQ